MLNVNYISDQVITSNKSIRFNPIFLTTVLTVPTNLSDFEVAIFVNNLTYLQKVSARVLFVFCNYQTITTTECNKLDKLINLINSPAYAQLTKEYIIVDQIIDNDNSKDHYFKGFTIENWFKVVEALTELSKKQTIAKPNDKHKSNKTVVDDRRSINNQFILWLNYNCVVDTEFCYHYLTKLINSKIRIDFIPLSNIDIAMDNTNNSEVMVNKYETMTNMAITSLVGVQQIISLVYSYYQKQQLFNSDNFYTLFELLDYPQSDKSYQIRTEASQIDIKSYLDAINEQAVLKKKIRSVERNAVLQLLLVGFTNKIQSVWDKLEVVNNTIDLFIARNNTSSNINCLIVPANDLVFVGLSLSTVVNPSFYCDLYKLASSTHNTLDQSNLNLFTQSHSENLANTLTYTQLLKSSKFNNSIFFMPKFLGGNIKIIQNLIKNLKN